MAGRYSRQHAPGIGRVRAQLRHRWLLGDGGPRQSPGRPNLITVARPPHRAESPLRRETTPIFLFTRDRRLQPFTSPSANGPVRSVKFQVSSSTATRRRALTPSPTRPGSTTAVQNSVITAASRSGCSSGTSVRAPELVTARSAPGGRGEGCRRHRADGDPPLRHQGATPRRHRPAGGAADRRGPRPACLRRPGHRGGGPVRVLRGRRRPHCPLRGRGGPGARTRRARPGGPCGAHPVDRGGVHRPAAG